MYLYTNIIIIEYMPQYTFETKANKRVKEIIAIEI